MVTSADDNGDTQIVYVNEAFSRLTGYSLEEVRGRELRFLQGDDREQVGRENLRHAIRQRARRFRALVEKSAFILEDLSLQVTVSLGVATTNGEKNVADLFRVVDDALYDAKESGRNRVCSAEGEGS